jgi:hypothetical protein
MTNKVFLKIHNFDCSIETINNVLGLLPSKAWIKGDPIEGVKNFTTRKNSVWQIESNVLNEQPITEHIKYMIDLISTKSEALKQLTKKYESEFTILSKCNQIEEFNYGFYLDKESISIISDVGLNIDIDIYFLPKSR